jgi:hypothetical protein
VRKAAALLLALALAAPLWGADVKVPAEVKVAPGRLARIVVETNGKVVQYVNVYDNADIFREYDPAAFVFRFLADAPGRYKVGFYAPDASPSPPAYCWVVVGDAPPPVPPGPVPPGPGPGPTPGGAFNRALILYESAELGKIPRAQENVLFSASVREALDAKCAPDAGGKTKAWRIWDKDVDASADGKPWQDLIARPRASVPWVILANDAGVVFEGPLPADVPATLALLAKYGPKSQQRKAG